MITTDELLKQSYDAADECVFGTSYRYVAQDFYNLYRSQLGLCRFQLNARYLSGTIGFGEFKGLYMCERSIVIPYYGQTAKALVKRLKRIQKLLDADLAKQG